MRKAFLLQTTENVTINIKPDFFPFFFTRKPMKAACLLRWIDVFFWKENVKQKKTVRRWFSRKNSKSTSILFYYKINYV